MKKKSALTRLTRWFNGKTRKRDVARRLLSIYVTSSLCVSCGLHTLTKIYFLDFLLISIILNCSLVKIIYSKRSSGPET